MPNPPHQSNPTYMSWDSYDPRKEFANEGCSEFSLPVLDRLPGQFWMQIGPPKVNKTAVGQGFSESLALLRGEDAGRDSI